LFKRYYELGITVSKNGFQRMSFHYWFAIATTKEPVQLITYKPAAL